MTGYLSHIRMTLRLSLRDRTVIFFNYLLPLMFFFLFGQMMHAEILISLRTRSNPPRGALRTS